MRHDIENIYIKEDQKFMEFALDEARRAMAENEVPIGAVLVYDGSIISSGYNRVEGLQDPTAHAEMITIRNAAERLGRWRLDGTTLYITLEPCCMCLGAVILARISRLVYAVNEPKTGVCGSQIDLLHTIFDNYELKVGRGILAEESRKLLQNFFESVRRGTEVWP